IGANRLEFAVIGNTVNVASRLEALTRRHDAVLVVSDALVERTRAENHIGEDVLRGLQPLADQEIRGIPEPLSVWAMPRLST
ncbi:MAG: adenylate/guanylate cyclase domain-containing protein, partial [Hyphomicrobiaceae bacterium]